MSYVIVSAKKLSGRIEPPPYKSEVIRFLILAGLCGIRPAEFVHLPNNCGEDIKNAVIAVNEAFFNTDAESGKASPLSVHVGESATLLRLLLPSLLRRHSQVRFLPAQPFLSEILMNSRAVSAAVSNGTASLSNFHVMPNICRCIHAAQRKVHSLQAEC